MFKNKYFIDLKDWKCVEWKKQKTIIDQTDLKKNQWELFKIKNIKD